MYVDDNLVLMDDQSLSGTSVTSTNNYDFGTSGNAGMFEMGFTVHTDGNVAGPTSVAVAVETSSNGTTWTEVVRHTFTTSEINNGIHPFNAPLRKARYVRLKVLSGDGTTAFTAGKVFAKLGGLGKPVRDIY